MDKLVNYSKHLPRLHSALYLGAVVLMSFSLSFFGSVVIALPQYSIKEGKDCMYCHFAHKGGGPTNARGRYYGKHFTFAGYPDKSKRVKKIQSPDGDSHSAPNSALDGSSGGAPSAASVNPVGPPKLNAPDAAGSTPKP